MMPTVAVYFFSKVSQYRKYKNTFHDQQIDQYIHTRDIFTKIRFIWRNWIIVILHNNEMKYCFSSLDYE